MSSQEKSVFLSSKKDSMMWMIGISALFVLGLTLQIFEATEMMSMAIGIGFVGLTFAFSVLLGTTGAIMSIIWDSLCLLIYCFEYYKYKEQYMLYLIALIVLAFVITGLYWLFLYKVRNAFEDYKLRIANEKTRRLSREETNLINEAIQRTNLIVRHNEMPSRQIVSQAIEITRSTGIDTLTTLPNRTRLVGHIDTLIDDCVSRSQASDDSNVIDILPIYVILISMDHTENFTLNSGHKMLDLFLQSMAHRIREVADGSDMVGRVSGTEFAIVTHRGISEDSLEYYIDTLRKAAASSFKDTDGNSIVTFSAGYAKYPRDGRFPGELMSKAEIAMSRARKSGGDKIESFSPVGTPITGFRTTMTNKEIREAINNAFAKDEFSMVYQPRIDRDKTLVGFEAFVRWGEYKTPEILDAAILTGDIYRIGKFSFTSAMKKLAEINTIEPRLMMTINLSTTQLRNSNILADFLDAISSTGCNPENLIVDIPEECILVEPEIVKPILEKFADMEIQISLDNFGRGYSSLNNIPLLPVSSLKLDGNFTSNLQSEATNGILAATIIELLDEIDMPVNATGVGNKEQYDLLMEYGCAYFQGLYISDPLLDEDLKKYILNYNPDNMKL